MPEIGALALGGLQGGVEEAEIEMLAVAEDGGPFDDAF